MGQRRKPRAVHDSSDQAERDQEVLPANRELAASFKGKRTDREARGALKIIAAFVGARAGTSAGSRPPLPGAHAARPSKADRKDKEAPE